MASLIALLPPLSQAQLQESQQKSIVAANIVVASLATISVVLRFWARWFQCKSFAVDDYLIAAALPFGWGMAAATVVATDHGLGRHLLAVLGTNPADLVLEGQAYFATELLWAIAILLVKLSILLLYVRLFGRLRYFRVLAWIVGVFTVLWAVMVLIVCCLQCYPIQYIWDKSIEGVCIDSWLFFVIGSGINAVTDLILLVLPLPAVWGLQLTTFQRISLTCIFLLGSLTCVFSVVRLANVIEDNNNLDITWALGIVSIWSTAEPCLGIVVASLPTMRPLILHFFQSVSTIQRRSTGASSGLGKSVGDYHIGLPMHRPSRSQDFDSIELRGAPGQGFRELRDDHRALGTQSQGSRSSPVGSAKKGVIEIRTTWETRHDC